jgi:hypothetical protein
MSTPSIGDDPEPPAERRDEVVKDVRIVAKAVNQDEGRAGAAPVQILESGAFRRDEARCVG